MAQAARGRKQPATSFGFAFMNRYRISQTTSFYTMLSCALLSLSCERSSELSRFERTNKEPGQDKPVAEAIVDAPKNPEGEKAIDIAVQGVQKEGERLLDDAPPVDFKWTNAVDLLTQIKSGPRRATLVNFWASWCGSCRHEIPMLLGLEKKLNEMGIDLLLVSLDETETLERAVELADTWKIPKPRLVNNQDLEQFKAQIDSRWPGLLPVSFLIEKNGTTRYFFAGEAFENEILEVMKLYVADELRDTISQYGNRAGRVGEP